MQSLEVLKKADNSRLLFYLLEGVGKLGDMRSL